MRTSLHDLVSEQAHTDGARRALTDRTRTVSYGDLWAESLAAAAALVGLGLRENDRVAVFLDKRIETVVAILGTSAAGGVFVPVNPVLRPAQVVHILADCSVRVLVTSPERLSSLREELKGCAALEDVVLVASRVGSSDSGDEVAGAADHYRTHAWSQLTRSTIRTPRSRIDLDMAAILYTSGSTGRPKGVVLSHRNLVVGAESVSSYIGNVPEDVILAALPLSFDAGFSQLTTAFAVGAHVILMNYVLPQDVPRLCAKHGVTGLTAVPPLWHQVAGIDWPEAATSSLRYFANTGGRMPRTTLDRLRQLFPRALPYLMYGLTEAFRSTYLDPGEIDRRPDSIGKAIPDAEVLVVRPDGTRCDPGEHGELVHRGALVALGYWGDETRTAERFRGAPRGTSEWRPSETAVWSGDTVVADEEGFLYFVGRADEMIKTSGYRVSPTEIEEAAYDSGLVRDAVALGVADDRLGQRVVLFVAPGDAYAEQGLLDGLRSRLPLFMVPSEIRVLVELPRSPNGKLDRVALRGELS